MTFDLHRVDSIHDYDEALEALEAYISDLVDQFVESPEGQAYLKAHPEMQAYVGSWIDNLLYFGYAYLSITLPHMTVDNVKTIVTELFQRKVSLLDPNQAETTMPELIAFWQFLKREYQLPKANSILRFLQKIQPKFKGIMNDPSKFGMAKSFFTAGMQAGFDMTTEEGLKAFQEQYNQNLQASTTLPSVEQEPKLDFSQQLRASMIEAIADELPPLSEEAIVLLKQQTITETEPGSILRDFQTLLEFIGEAGTTVSGTRHHLPMKSLATLNERLTEPIEIDLKRPQQKSYPNINGLYLLLRASGLGQITGKGKQRYLVLNPRLLECWNTLNATERYFTLFEAWLIRGHAEMLGESKDPLSEGARCLRFWPDIPGKGQKISNYNEQEAFKYWPGFHNLALLQLFGLLHLEAGKPEAGQGWRIKKVKRQPLGDALMQVVFRDFLEHGMSWESEDDPTVPFGELQPTLQPYFPEWQNTLVTPQHKFRSGVYIFKVSLGKAWRRLAISSQMTLADLSSLILESVDFDSDHLDMFTYANPSGRTVEITHPYADQSPSTDEVRIGDLPLAEGASMTYVFDFGDWWEFEVQLEQVQSDDSRSNYAAIIESHGEAPTQYPDWDETD